MLSKSKLALLESALGDIADADFVYWWRQRSVSISALSDNIDAALAMLAVRWLQKYPKNLSAVSDNDNAASALLETTLMYRKQGWGQTLSFKCLLSIDTTAFI